MILRSKYLKYDVKTIETQYHRRKFGKPHFGKAKDIIYSLYDVIKFRIYSLFLIFGK